MRPSIGVLGFDGVAALDLVGLLEVLKAARDDRDQPFYEVALLGLNRTNFVSDSGMRFQADKLLRSVSVLDTLVIPGGQASETDRAVQQIGPRLTHRRLVSIPAGTSGIEMALRLIAADHGEKEAALLARRFSDGLVAAEPETAAPNERLSQLPAWIQSNLCANLTVEALAEKACVCPRHFSRLFKSTFKVTPADFVARLRLAEAQRQLDRPRAKVSAVASAVGFKSADAFRRAFQREHGINPGKFRRRPATNS